MAIDPYTLPDVLEMSQKAYQLYDAGQTEAAVKLILDIEAKATSYTEQDKQILCRTYAAPCLIDIGSGCGDEVMIRRGIEYLLEYDSKYPPQIMGKANLVNNIANGYFDSWRLQAKEHLLNGIDAEDHKIARKYYRQSLNQYRNTITSRDLYCQILTNYGNTLDTIGRCFEAIDAYDEALRVNPDMGMALGNKAVALMHLVPMMPSLTHRIYLESIRLLEKAVQQPLDFEAKISFSKRLDWLQGFVKAHGEMQPENIDFVTPTSDFHKFLCNFCAKHLLFLSPVTFLSEEERTFYGDPMFIENMIVPLSESDKAERYVTFLNEIKQDYVLGRFMLVQSQYRLPNLDIVDEGVSLIYPLDYSLHSIYIQLLKAALKQAIAVLDKIAYFIYDYCKLTTPDPHKVSFRQLFGGNPTMRKDLNTYQNPYLFALHSLSLDVSKDGDWQSVYENRDALTHRFLVLHDLDLGEQQANKDIPRENEVVFTQRVILATKIARSAVMYLILFVAMEEAKVAAKTKGYRPTIYATPLDKGFRHKPHFGE